MKCNRKNLPVNEETKNIHEFDCLKNTDSNKRINQTQVNSELWESQQ